MSITRDDTQDLATGSEIPAGGTWIDHWSPEDETFWQHTGRAVARRNLGWSIGCEFLGFVVWQLWSVVVVLLPKAGFTLTTAESFWLISLPSLVGGTLRFPYKFMVGRFGGRNWTIVSVLLLLIPTVGLAVCVGNPQTPFAWLLIFAGCAGVGGGNCASSMANITFFFPARDKGWALGLNAAGGNLGASVAQFVVPIAVTLTAGLGLIAAVGAYGGFIIPQILSASKQAGGSYSSAFIAFAVGYLVLLIITVGVYARGSAGLNGTRV